MNDTQILEPVGPCPITGYPLVAIHEATGCHAGLALAHLEEVEHAKRHHPETPAPARLRLEDIATTSEMLRSWTELLIFAVNERFHEAPLHAQNDYLRCHDLLSSRHHYDTSRIIASVHIAAVEYLRVCEPWSAPALVLVPDVGLDHVRTTAQAAVRRLAGADATIGVTVDRLRVSYLQRLAAVA